MPLSVVTADFFSRIIICKEKINDFKILPFSQRALAYITYEQQVSVNIQI